MADPISGIVAAAASTPPPKDSTELLWVIVCILGGVVAILSLTFYRLLLLQKNKCEEERVKQNEEHSEERAQFFAATLKFTVAAERMANALGGLKQEVRDNMAPEHSPHQARSYRTPRPDDDSTDRIIRTGG